MESLLAMAFQDVSPTNFLLFAVSLFLKLNTSFLLVAKLVLYFFYASFSKGAQWFGIRDFLCWYKTEKGKKGYKIMQNVVKIDKDKIDR